MKLTKCTGFGCLAKAQCKRFIENKTYDADGVFAKPPFEIDKGKFNCEMFWGESSDYLLNQLKSLMWKSPMDF